MKKATTTLVTSFIIFSLFLSAQDFPAVQYGPESRQFADIYLAPSDCPTPVYFDAHGNGGTTNMPNSIINDLKDAGISVVAWESLTSINTQEQVETGWADAELMFAWVKENAATYNFDTTNFIIGGSSRGSILSWKYGHRADPDIRGLYMYNALPDGAWADANWWYPPDEVTVDSPPIFFVYRPEPGTTTDSHDPENGMIIMDTYDALGIGDRDTLIHSIGTSGNDDKYQFLVDFALSVIEPCGMVGTETLEEQPSAWRVFPNPFRDHFEVSGLTGEEQFQLTNASGTPVGQYNDLDTLNMQKLPAGLYFLIIQNESGREVFRVLKG